MINDTLGLPFEQPEETYSTSPHLYHDLGIDPAAKGTIGPADRTHRSDRMSPVPRTSARTRPRRTQPAPAPGDGSAMASLSSGRRP